VIDDQLPADLTAPITTYGSSGSGVGTANPGKFNYIEDLDVAPDGRVWIADTNNNRVQVFGLDGTFKQEVFVERKTALLGTAFSIAFSPDPGQPWMYVADAGNGRVRIFDRKAPKGVGGFGPHRPSPGPFYST